MATYLVFPEGFQPTQTQISELNTALHMLGGNRWGVDENTGGLVMECESEQFEHTLEHHMNFSDVIKAWRKQGMRIAEGGIDFVADESALKPMDDVTQVTYRPHTDEGREQHARERVAISRVENDAKWQQYWDRINNLQSVSKAVPFVLGSAVAAGTIYGGYKLGNALQGIENRRATTERVAEDAMAEDLHTQRIAPTLEDKPAEYVDKLEHERQKTEAKAER